jgi:hypothetical protein
MSSDLDLQPMLDDPQTDLSEVALLRAGRAEAMSDETRRKVLAGIGVGGAALGLATVSSSVGHGSSAGWASWPAWLQTGLVLTTLGGVAATLAFFGFGSEPQVTAQQPAAQVAEPRPAQAAAPPSTVEAPGVPVMQATDLPVEPATGVSAGGGDKAAQVQTALPEAPTAEPSLAAELDAIRPAKTRLAAGDAAGALAQVRQYRTQFPKGRLAVEATVIEVEALVALGQRSAAEKQAAPLLKGDSPYAARLRTLLTPNSAQKP